MITYSNKKLTWEDIIIQGSNYNKLIVSGCQRTGTSIAAKALSEVLGYIYYDETSFDFWNQKKFHSIFSRDEKSVIQAPALLHILPYYQDKALIVIMEREISEVVSSMLRVGWFNNYGKNEYKKFTPDRLDKPEDIYRVKNEFSRTFYNVKLDYSELMKSTLFVSDRNNWNIKQIKS